MGSSSPGGGRSTAPPPAGEGEGWHSCRVCGEGVAGGEVEHHTALHHPRGKFARAGKVVVKEKDNSIKTEKKDKLKMEEAKEPNAVTRKEGKVEVNVKKKEKVKTEKTEQSKRKLEEVTELGAVTRMPGETRVRLTRGEADLVLGRDAKIVIALKRRTGTKISIKGASGDKNREMVITGEDRLVSLAEEEAVKVLMSNTFITMKLKTQETMCLMGVGGRDIEKLQDISGAKITTETNSSTAKLNEVIISGTPEAVATAKSIIKDFLSTGQVIEVTKRQFRILMGRGGWKVREMQDSTGAVIETGDETEEDSEMREITIYGSDEAKGKALQSIYDLFRKLGV